MTDPIKLNQIEPISRRGGYVDRRIAFMVAPGIHAPRQWSIEIEEDGTLHLPPDMTMAEALVLVAHCSSGCFINTEPPPGAVVEDHFTFARRTVVKWMPHLAEKGEFVS